MIRIFVGSDRVDLSKQEVQNLEAAFQKQYGPNLLPALQRIFQIKQTEGQQLDPNCLFSPLPHSPKGTELVKQFNKIQAQAAERLSAVTVSLIHPKA